MQEKKECFFSRHNIKYIDYKDVDLLRRFLSPYGRVLPRRKTGVSAGNQRKLALAVKRARYMALLPYLER